MVSIKSILASAAVLAVAIAQTPKIAFTSVPAAVVAGSTYNITWGGGDGTAVTLTLRKGDPNNLDTVDTLANRVTEDYYMWTVSDKLATASDYALQITQGQSDINYSGQFSIVGGTGTSSISYSGLTTQTASNTTGTHDKTMSLTGTAASMGTGTALPRNTTFSTQSLTSSVHNTESSRPTITAAESTARNAQSTSSPNSNVGASMGSSAALVMGVVGAIMFFQ